MKVPLFDPNPQIEAHREEIDRAIANVIDHGQFILGPEVEELENKLAAFLDVKHAIGVNSGTDALVIALRALGIGKGDEVITTPFSFFATAESISMVGAKPVFVDVDEETYNLEPANIEPAITGNTRAILPVHLFGRPAEMDAIMEIAGKHNLRVIEDCAQSFGAEYNGRQTGSIGHAGAFSFFPTKNLGGFGDGGLITTDSDDIAALARKLRTHGSVKKYHNEMLGYNSRLDTIQAAALLVKLQNLDEANQQRRTIAKRYNDALNSKFPNPQSLVTEVSTQVTPILNPQSVPGHVFHQYTVRILNGKRDNVREYLQKEGIGTAVYYPVPQHRLPVYEGQYAELPVAEQLAGEVLSLPIYPGMTEEQQERVVEALKKAMDEV